MTKYYSIGILILSVASLTIGAIILVAIPTDALVLRTEFTEDMYVPFFLEGLQEGETLPHFVATDLDGNQYDTRNLVGQPIFLKFWSPRCPYCRGEIAAVRTMYEDMRDDYVFLTVVSGVPANEVASFVAEQDITYPVLIDDDGRLADRFSIKAIPFTYYIDERGKIENIVIGAQDSGSSCTSSSHDIGDECKPNP